MVPISIPFSASVDFPMARTRLLKAVETMTKGVLHATYPYFKNLPTAVSMIFFNRLRFIILFRISKFHLVEDGHFQTIHITLKYGADKNEKVITGLKRISKPGLRVYANTEDIPRVLGGLGTAIISTNKGVVTDKETRKLGVGGEVLCFVW